jgi:hypothetical protein
MRPHALANGATLTTVRDPMRRGAPLRQQARFREHECAGAERVHAPRANARFAQVLASSRMLVKDAVQLSTSRPQEPLQYRKTNFPRCLDTTASI